jgi:4-carboxymuconolactone decarboxylase
VPTLPYYDPADGPVSIAERLDGAPLNLFRMVAHAQSAFEPWLRYSGALLGALELDPVLRELAILQVAHLLDSQYEWVQHVAIALAVGAGQEQIAAIEHDREEDPSLSDQERLILRFSREVILDGAASEERVAEVSALVGPRQVIELLLLIGNYMAIARLIATTGLEPEPPIAPGSLTSGIARLRGGDQQRPGESQHGE